MWDKTKKAEYDKKNYIKNGDYIRNRVREYKINNPEKVKAQRQRETRGLRLRFKILQRDCFTCQYCGRKAPNVELQIDHIYPKSKGGLDREENYKTSCRDCNIGKSNLIY